MNLGTTRKLNHQNWISFELFVDFTSLQKKRKEKGKGFTLILRTGRDLAGQRTGPGPASRAHPLGGHVEGVFVGVRLCAGEADLAEAVST